MRERDAAVLLTRHLRERRFVRRIEWIPRPGRARKSRRTVELLLVAGRQFRCERRTRGQEQQERGEQESRLHPETEWRTASVANWSSLLSSRPVHQREDVRFFCIVRE
jgi:hypothetical protein